MKKIWVISLSLILALGLVIYLFNNSQVNTNDNQIRQGITIFRSTSCGCCSLYSSYISDNNFVVDSKLVQDMVPIKEQNKIPTELQSCHTSIIGGYFVEGHIPVEAINKLMQEKPNIAGIGMPGMPSGSPGMPGSKTGDFVITAVNKDGSMYEFMRI